MIDESLRKLRLDRRLQDRPGWISKGELDRELASLPDVSEKIAPPEETPAPRSPEGGAGAEDASEASGR
jgi:hypothetical protein